MRSLMLSLLGGIIAAGCATPENGPLVDSGCAKGHVVLTTDFEGARAADCTRTGQASFKVHIRPEANPVNPSPWYAFDLVTDRPVTPTLELIYEGAPHRYRPDIRPPGGDWMPLPESSIATSDDGYVARLTIPIEAGRTRIASQEVLTPDERQAWVEAFADRAGLELRTIGKSVEDRNIVAAISKDARADAPFIVILGGQHPPEVPGTLALRSFLDALLDSGSDTHELTASFNVLIIPELNPDGIAGGNWRLNAAGTDLNRDWGPFSQPETTAARDEIDRWVERGGTPILLLDFHATWKNVLYTPPNDAGLAPTNFARAWLNALEAASSGQLPERRFGHNPDKPTAKSWFAATYGAPGITVEFGDDVIRRELEASSEALAKTLFPALNESMTTETAQ